MEGSIAEALYPETLQLSNAKLSPTSTIDNQQCDSHGSNGDDLCREDESLWDGSLEELDRASDLDREWQRRHKHFHAIGYRDGFLAGKEASAQEGFNIGFRESVSAGFNWGLVRGVTSALACLPDGLKERLVETQEKKQKFQCLYESTHSLSTTDALKLFHVGLTSKSVKQSDNIELGSHAADLLDESEDQSLLENCSQELQSLLFESSALQVHIGIDQ